MLIFKLKIVFSMMLLVLFILSTIFIMISMSLSYLIKKESIELKKEEEIFNRSLLIPNPFQPFTVYIGRMKNDLPSFIHSLIKIRRL